MVVLMMTAAPFTLHDVIVHAFFKKRSSECPADLLHPDLFEKCQDTLGSHARPAGGTVRKSPMRNFWRVGGRSVGSRNMNIHNLSPLIKKSNSEERISNNNTGAAAFVMSSWYNASAPVRPVVIQGHPVQPQHSSTYAASPYSHKQQQLQQQQQPYQAQHEEDHPQPQRGCRDVFWGVLFYVHLGAMAAAAAVYAPQVIGSAVENYSGGGGDGGGRRFLLLDDDTVTPTPPTFIVPWRGFCKTTAGAVMLTTKMWI